MLRTEKITNYKNDNNNRYINNSSMRMAVYGPVMRVTCEGRIRINPIFIFLSLQSFLIEPPDKKCLVTKMARKGFRCGYQKLQLSWV